MHPVGFIREVEVSPNLNSPGTMERAETLLASLGFKPFRNMLEQEPDYCGGELPDRRLLFQGEIGEQYREQQRLVSSGQPGAVRGEAGGALMEPEPQAAHARGSDGNCNICLDKVADAIILPCGHTESCVACARTCFSRGLTCPTCRAPIEKVLAQAPRT